MYFQLSAQSYVSRWQYSWGGDRQDMLNVMIPLPGNQYFFAGTAASDISCTKSSTLYGDEDFAVMLFDDSGNKLWEKSYGGNGWDQLHSAIRPASGGYMLAGETQSGSSGIKTSGNNGVSDFWVMRIDNNGNLLWEKSYGGADIESAVKILETADGGYLVGGLSLSNIPGYNNGVSDYLLMKLDKNGNLQWSKLYGGTGTDELYDLAPTSDGNYFLCGTSASPVSGNKTSAPLGAEDIWLVKVDANGNKLWDKTYGTAEGDFRGRLVSLSDGNTIIVESSVNTGRIRKIDNNGNQVWLQICSGNNQDFFETATEDPVTKNIYVAGTSKTDNFGCKTSPYNGGGWFSDIWIAVFDSAGNKIDDLDYGGNDADIPVDIDIVNNEIWITGWSDSPLSGNKTTGNCGQTADGWIIRLSKKFYINNNTPASLCQAQLNSKVHFTTTWDYNNGNIFAAQLSDANGSFSNPVNIGHLAAIRSDSINVNLPADLLPGAGYRIRVIASAPADTTEVHGLWIYGAPVLNLGNDTLLCAGASLVLSPGTQPINTQYLWQDNSKNNFYTVLAQGLYWCEVQNGCGIARDSINIQYKQKPAFSIGEDFGFCTGATVAIQSTPQPADVVYLWSTGENKNNISVSKGGLYWLRSSNTCGNVTDSINITEHSLPAIALNRDSIICSGSDHILNAGNGFANYVWSTGANTASITINAEGTYWVKVTDNNFCSQADTVIITKVAQRPAHFLADTISKCSYEDLILAPSQSFIAYLWSDGSTSKSTVVKATGIYSLQVMDKYACQGTDTIIVNPKKCIEGFFVPNAFTPNNDGHNDTFKPIIGGIMKSYQFTVYSRWGAIVFSSGTPKEGWNGMFKNMPMDSNAFVWVCTYQLEGMDKVTEKGTVLLIR